MIDQLNRVKHTTISYAPGLIDSGDLIVGTKTITAIAEAAGLGNADYSVALTLPMSCTVNGVAKVIGTTETRLQIIRVGTRSSITIDSDDGTHDLKCRIYVDVQDANHLLQDLTFTTTGNQLSVADVYDTAGGTPRLDTLFALLKDGSAHTFYFYFWSPGNHSPVISFAQVWEAWGACGTPYNYFAGITLNTPALVTLDILHLRVGAGTRTLRMHPDLTIISSGQQITEGYLYLYTISTMYLALHNIVETDLNYIKNMHLFLRSDN